MSDGGTPISRTIGRMTVAKKKISVTVDAAVLAEADADAKAAGLTDSNDPTNSDEWSTNSSTHSPVRDNPRRSLPPSDSDRRDRVHDR
jgi:hypothetical protein